MNIELISENKIKIALNSEDMKRLDISYSEFDYASMNTRRIIWTLLCEAKNSLDLELDLFSKMMIEVVPEGEDGCIIFFTIIDGGTSSSAQSKILIRKNFKPCIFEFKNSDQLMHAFENINYIPETAFNNSELFLMGNRYRLILSTFNRDPNDIPDHFTEFGAYIGEGFDLAAVTREHGKLIADSSGVKKMAKAFCLSDNPSK